MKKDPFAFLLNQLDTHMPEALRPMSDKLKSSSRQFVEDRLTEFDLVPKSVFLAQQQQLEQALVKIAQLEAKLDALETRALDNAQTTSSQSTSSVHL